MAAVSPSFFCSSILSPSVGDQSEDPPEYYDGYPPSDLSIKKKKFSSHLKASKQ